MIPIIHQSLLILPLGKGGSVEDISEAPGFLAVLAEQDDSPGPPGAALSAEACLAVGMIVTAPPTLLAQPILQTKPVRAAEPVLSPPAISKPESEAPDPTIAPATEGSTSPLESAQTVSQAAPIAITVPLALTAQNTSQPTTFMALEDPAADVSKQAPSPATGAPALPIMPYANPRGTGPAKAVTRPINTDPIAALPPPPTAIAPAAAMAEQITAAEIIFAAETTDQPAQKTSLTSHAIMRAPKRSEANTSPFHGYSTHLLPTQIPDDQAAPQQIARAETQPPQTLSVQAQPDQIPHGLMQDTPPAPVPDQQIKSISSAEAAWQTRLQVALPLGAPSKPPPTPLKTVASVAQAANGLHPKINAAETAPSDQPATTTSVKPRSDMALKPAPDAAAIANPPAAPLDQSTLQPALQANPASQPPIPQHQTVQTSVPPPDLAATVAVQLHQHTAAAKADGVDVLLQPEELGHVKFQIQQHGETVRILLSAERPETLDLLRRHSDLLLQEFRQSGFAQASLNFGQWGQQQQHSKPQHALCDANAVEAPQIPRPLPTPLMAQSGQGLNLRL